MKRQISISIFLAILLVVLSFVYIKVNNETKPKEREISTEQNTQDSIEISQEYETYQFFIKEEHGRLVVYHMKNQEIYMETGIEIQTLPQEIIEKLESGIYFKTERELYDFLESYSS